MPDLSDELMDVVAMLKARADACAKQAMACPASAEAPKFVGAYHALLDAVLDIQSSSYIGAHARAQRVK